MVVVDNLRVPLDQRGKLRLLSRRRSQRRRHPVKRTGTKVMELVVKKMLLLLLPHLNRIKINRRLMARLDHSRRHHLREMRIRSHLSRREIEDDESHSSD